MRLTPESIREFRDVIFAEYGKEISEQEAEIQGQNLLTFLQVIFNQNDYDESKRQR
jgi:hypothetical protein